MLNTYLVSETIMDLAPSQTTKTAECLRLLGFCLGLLVQNPADEKKGGGDADAGIGDVERGPPSFAPGRDFFIVRQPDGNEIDNVSLRKPFPEGAIREST